MLCNVPTWFLGLSVIVIVKIVALVGLAASFSARKLKDTGVDQAQREVSAGRLRALWWRLVMWVDQRGWPSCALGFTIMLFLDQVGFLALAIWWITRAWILRGRNPHQHDAAWGLGTLCLSMLVNWMPF